MSALAAALCSAALVAGLTGTWSPCGFSMIDSLAAGTRSGRHRLTRLACAAFAAGCAAGGCVLFGGLASLGALLAAAGAGPPAVAAGALAGGVAVAELAGLRVRPQVRRQVPEHWRRVAPLPLAALGYGLLLGLGFTTFVLSFAVPALAAVALVLAHPVLGLAMGAAFGVGRALPVVAIAPVADSERGVRAIEAMAERPATLRGLRVAAGVLLALCAIGLATGPALAATTVAQPATDPSAAPGGLAWQVPGGTGILRRDATTVPVAGRAPAVGAGLLATIDSPGVLVVRRLSDLGTVLSRGLPGADKLAITARWLVARTIEAGRARIVAFPLTPGGVPRTVAIERRGEQLGRPAAQGDRVTWHANSRRQSRIVEANLATGRTRTQLRTRGALLLNPSIDGPRTLYVRVTTCGQFVVLRRGAAARVLARRRALSDADRGFGPGHTSQGGRNGPCQGRRAADAAAWTTAISGGVAYVAFIRPSAGPLTDATLESFGIGGSG